MREAYLFTDDHWIPDELHNGLKTELQKVGFKVRDERGDSGAKGGIIWFASGWVIELSVLGAAVLGIFLSDKLLSKLTEVLSSAEFKRVDRPFYIGADGKVYGGKGRVYFSFGPKDAPYSKEIIRMAFESIPEAKEELKKLLSSDFLGNYNNPNEIVMSYDKNLKKWLIKHFDIDTKIYFNEVTNEYSPDSFNPAIRLFNKIMKVFR